MCVNIHTQKCYLKTLYYWLRLWYINLENASIMKDLGYFVLYASDSHNECIQFGKNEGSTVWKKSQGTWWLRQINMPLIDWEVEKIGTQFLIHISQKLCHQNRMIKCHSACVQKCMQWSGDTNWLCLLLFSLPFESVPLPDRGIHTFWIIKREFVS